MGQLTPPVIQACKCSIVINLQLEGQLKTANFIIAVKIVHDNKCITIFITIWWWGWLWPATSPRHSLIFYHNMHSHQLLQGPCSLLYTATTAPQKPNPFPAHSCSLCWNISPAISGFHLALISQDCIHQRWLALHHVRHPRPKRSQALSEKK